MDADSERKRDAFHNLFARMIATRDFHRFERCDRRLPRHYKIYPIINGVFQLRKSCRSRAMIMGALWADNMITGIISCERVKPDYTSYVIGARNLVAIATSSLLSPLRMHKYACNTNAANSCEYTPILFVFYSHNKLPHVFKWKSHEKFKLTTNDKNQISMLQL